jgi:hypothetical protein
LRQIIPLIVKGDEQGNYTCDLQSEIDIIGARKFDDDMIIIFIADPLEPRKERRTFTIVAEHQFVDDNLAFITDLGGRAYLFERKEKC